GSPYELVLPAWLTFYIKDTALFRPYVHEPGEGIVRAVSLAGKRIDGKGKRFGSGSARIEEQTFRLNVAIRTKGDLAGCEHLGAITHGQHRLAPGISALMEADTGGQARIGQGASGQTHIVDLHVLVLLAAESNGVNGNVAVAQRGDGIQVDSAGIVRSVGQQHHGSNRQICGFVCKLLEAVCDARYRRCCM